MVTSGVLLVFFLLVVVGPSLFFSIIQKYYTKITVFETWYGTLTEELRQSPSTSVRFYYPFFLVSRLAIIFALVFFYSFPYIQCGSLMAILILNFTWLAVSWPHKDEFEKIVQPLDLVFLVCIISSLVSLNVNSPSDASKHVVYGWIIVSLVVFATIKSLLYATGVTLKQLIGVLKPIFKKPIKERTNWQTKIPAHSPGHNTESGLSPF